MLSLLEDEEALPKGWEPFNIEYLDYPQRDEYGCSLCCLQCDQRNGWKKLEQTAAFMRVAFTNQVQGPYEKGRRGS